MMGSARTTAWAVVLAVGIPALASASSPPSPSSSNMVTHKVEGLWRHDDLITSAGKHMPLAGVFLFQDGVFVEQAVLQAQAGEPATAMAHAGPYAVTSDGVQIVAEQTIGLSSADKPPLSYRHATQHVLHVSNTGPKMTIRFGSGTVQTFSRIGPGAGKIYDLGNGRFALVDHHFILVAGDGSGVVTGYGTYRRHGTNYALTVEHWAEGDTTRASISNGRTLNVTFDGKTLELPGGRHLAVVP